MTDFRFLLRTGITAAFLFGVVFTTVFQVAGQQPEATPEITAPAPPGEDPVTLEAPVEGSVTPTPINPEEETYYIVQKGDTLWSIAEKFYGSPWHWPDLWTINSDLPIMNPHFIYPGQRLKIFPRPKPSAPVPVPITPAIPTPVPEKPAPEPTPEVENVFQYSLIHRVGFVRKEAVSPLGVLFKVHDDKVMMISEGDIVFVKPAGDAQFNLGGLYTLYRTYTTPGDHGIQHLFTGVLEIAKLEDKYAVARIRDSYRTIRVGDKLMTYEELSPRIVLKEPAEGITGTLFLLEKRQNMSGEHDIAFIDRGAADGLKPGQKYELYYPETGRLTDGSREETPLVPLGCGEFLVVRVEENTATVLILQTERDIYPGVRFRTPVDDGI